MKRELISLRGRGWACAGTCVALVRLRDRSGFALGVQDPLRSGGVGQIWPSLRKARRRAAYLAAVHSIPVAEAI